MKQKSTFLKVFMTLLLLLGVSSVWGANVSYTITFEKGESDQGTGAPSISSGSEFATLSYNKYAYARTNGMHLSSGSNAGNATLTMTEKGNVVASSIVINALAKSGKSFSVTVTYADKTTEYKVFTPGTTTTDNTFELKNTKKQKISSIYLSASSGSGTGIASVKVVYEVESKELVSLKVTGTPSKTTYETGETFNPAGLTVTGTYDDSSTKDLTNEAEWTFDPATFTSTSQTSVSVTATVSEITSDAYPVNGLTVTAAPLKVSFSGAEDSDVTFAEGSSAADKAIWAGSPCAKGIITLTGNVSSGTNYSYYDGSVVRFYTNNNLILTPATGYKITKVEIVRQTTTGSNGGTINCNGLTADNNNTTTNTNIFTGSATSGVTFTVTAQARFTSITVFYAVANPSAAVPTITPSVEADAYFEPFTVSLATETDGAAIYYTTNGDEPTATSTLYESPINVSATTTIKAIAVKDGLDNSDVASKTFKFGPIFNSLDELVNADLAKDAVVKVSFEDAKITDLYTNTSGKRYGVYLNTKKDGNDIEIYCTTAEHPETWAVNGTLSGTLFGKWTVYNDKWEICPDSWDGLEYTAPKAISSIEISGTATKSVYTEGEFFNDYSGLTVTATYTDNTTDDVTGLVKWSVNPSTALTTDVKSVTVTASINEVTDDAVVNITVNPEPTNFVWDLTIDETESATEEEISWASPIANMKDVKGSGSGNTPANNYYPGIGKSTTRFYTNSTLTITPKNGHIINYLVFDATSENYADAVNGTWANASSEKNGTKVTVTPTDGSAAFYINFTAACGLNSVKVYYTIPTEYTRTVTEGNFGTICLPYDGTVEGATLYSIAGKEMDGEAVKNLVLNEEGDELMGGMPYVFKATAGTLTVSYDSNDTDAEDATDFEGLYGTYDAIKTLPKDGTVYVISQNQFWCVNSDVSCGANRAYIVLSEVKEASSANNLIIGNGNLADGINAVVVAPADSKMYNLNGQAVGADYKGVVIMNGKKMFNK